MSFHRAKKWQEAQEGLRWSPAQPRQISVCVCPTPTCLFSVDMHTVPDSFLLCMPGQKGCWPSLCRQHPDMRGHSAWSEARSLTCAGWPGSLRHPRWNRCGPAGSHSFHSEERTACWVWERNGKPCLRCRLPSLMAHLDGV